MELVRAPTGVAALSKIAAAARAADAAAEQSAHEMQAKMLQDARSAELRIDAWPTEEAKGGVRLQARRCCRWFFGTVPRKFGLRRRIEVMLSLTPMGHAWDLLQSILSIVSCTFYVLATYDIDVPIWIDIVITFLFLADYILRWYAAQSRWKYPFSFFAIVDLLTILPVVLQTIIPLIIPSFALLGVPTLIGLYFFRMVRVIRIVRILRVFKLVSFFNDEVNRLLVVFGLTVISIVFISAGAIYTVEMELFALFDDYGRPRQSADTGADTITFVDAMYIIVVTISTTGYGDILIATWFGRLVVGVIIMLSLVIIPVELGKIRGLLLQRSVYLTSYIPSARMENRHVIVAGNVTNAPMLRSFFAEFYHPDRVASTAAEENASGGGGGGGGDEGEEGGGGKGDESSSVGEAPAIVVGPNDPIEEVVYTLDNPLIKTKARYIRGTLMREADLVRIAADDARACFIMCDKAATDASLSDDATIMRALVIENFNPKIRTFVQLIEPRRKEQLRHTGVDTVMCLEEMKMQLLGAASNCLGVNTLLDNLLNSFTVPKSITKPWQVEYCAGCSTESFAVPYPHDWLGAITWEKAVLSCYNISRGAAIVIGLIVGGEHTMHPGNDFVVPAGATLLVVAEDRDTAFMIIRPANHRKSQVLAVEADVDCDPITPLCPVAPGHDVAYDDKSDELLKNSQGLPRVGTARNAGDAEGVSSSIASASIGVEPSQRRGLRVLYDARPLNIRGHVVVCGSMANVELLLRAVRAPSFEGTILHKPVVLLHPVTDDEKRSLQNRLAEYTDVFLVCGEPKKHTDLERVSIENACCCVLLADREDLVEVDTDALSIKTIFTYLSIEKYVARLQQKNGPEAMKYFSVITELSSSSTMRILNSKRLQRDSTKLIEHDDMGAARHSAKENKGFFSRLAVADAALIDPLAGRQMIDFFAAGFGFSPIMFDSLICQCYYNAHVMPMLDDMVGFAPNLTLPNSPGGGGGGGAHGDSSATATLYGKIKAAREKSHVAATQITGSMQSTMSAPIRNPERGRGVSLRPLTGGDVGGEEGASGEGSWVPAVDGTASSDVFGKLGERGYLCRAIQVNIPEIFHRKQWSILYRHLVTAEGVMPVAIYRSPEAAGPLAPAQLPYIFTAPSADTVMHKHDTVIVIVRTDNPLIMRTTSGQPMNMGVKRSAAAR